MLDIDPHLPTPMSRPPFTSPRSARCGGAGVVAGRHPVGSTAAESAAASIASKPLNRRIAALPSS
jgi:hypothetical protein